MRKRFIQLPTGGDAVSEFRTVTYTTEAAPGDMKLVDLDGEEIVIANVDGEYFAFNNTRPHAGGRLAEGFARERQSYYHHFRHANPV